MNDIESFVNCPNCREQVKVVLAPYTGITGGLSEMIDKSLGIEKSEHFSGSVKCKCGKNITASLHVTSMG